MQVLILHDAVGADGRADERDVLDQAALVEHALTAAGHGVVRRPFDLDLAAAAGELRHVRPDLVFNLVESVARAGSLIHLAPALLDHLRIPYTGSSTEAMFTSSNKILSKERMRGAGIPTPRWFTAALLRRGAAVKAGRFIVKSVWEHASIGLGPGAVAPAAGSADLLARIEERAPALGGAAFAEEFIDGREFNVSVLEVDGSPEILPVAEIRFVGFGPDRPRVVGYDAKWNPQSDDWRDTPRTFDLGPADRLLVERLRALATRCWHTFGLSGYARVDFRVATDGTPFVLEINVNPCIAPDAGFMAAVVRCGRTPPDAVGLIVAAALRNARA